MNSDVRRESTVFDIGESHAAVYCTHGYTSDVDVKQSDDIRRDPVRIFQVRRRNEFDSDTIDGFELKTVF